MTNIKKVLTFAGSDASGGAGLAADLKTFSEYSTYGMVALTTIATMDPDNNWKHNVTTLPISVVEEQLKTILAGDTKIAAMKTGMLGSVEIVELVATTISAYQFPKVVIDPVLACKGEDELLNPETAAAIQEYLLPLADVATPNLLEAGIFSGLGKLTTLEDMKKAAEKIFNLGTKHVVVKGGKSFEGDKAIDIYYDGEKHYTLETEKIQPACNHGAGCTFAAAITAGLATGLSEKEAIFKAKDFVTAAIEHGFRFNEFVGPVFHGAYRLKDSETI